MIVLSGAPTTDTARMSVGLPFVTAYLDKDTDGKIEELIVRARDSIERNRTIADAVAAKEELESVVEGMGTLIEWMRDSGAKLRVRVRGQPSPRGGPAGDLILNITVGAHPYFRREGRNVLLDVPVTFAEAVLGTTVTVPLLRGSAEVKVPPGASSGQKLRIKGQGITPPKGDPGDFLAVIQIVAPRGLSERGTGLVRDLAERLDRGYYAFKECRENISKPPSEYLKEFYYDTVNFDVNALELASKFAGTDQLVAGSDYPHQIGSLEKMIESIDAMSVPEEDKAKIYGGNTKHLGL